MVQYRRNRVAGGTYFFTVTLKNRQSRLLTDHIGELRAAYRYARNHYPFETLAIVVLPDHLHTVWRLPEDDADYSGRWRAIKSRFTRALGAAGPHEPQGRPLESSPWQRRFWEHTIRSEMDLRRHIDYIHYNPVKHQLVNRVADWPYSSFHRYVQRGELPNDWGSSAMDFPAQTFGESP